MGKASRVARTDAEGDSSRHKEEAPFQQSQARGDSRVPVRQNSKGHNLRSDHRESRSGVRMANQGQSRVASAGTSVQIELFSLWSSDIQVSVTPSDRPFTSRIVQLVSEWATSKSSIPHWHKYKTKLLFASVFLFWIWGSLSNIGLIRNPSGKLALFDEARQLTKDGVLDQSEHGEALSVLLRLATGDYQSETTAGMYTWYSSMLFVAVSMFVASVLCPTSMIGVGKAHNKFVRSRWVLWASKGLICFWVAGILSSAFGSWLFEFAKSIQP